MTALADVKAALRVIHADDDALLTRLIASATRESLAFLDSGAFPQLAVPPTQTIDDLVIPDDVFQAVVLLVSADYDAPPDKREVYRKAAEGLLMPYRVVGV